MSNQIEFNEIKHRLEQTKKAWKRISFWSGVSILLSAFVIFFFSELLVDIFLPLPRIIRMFLLLGAVCAIGYVAYKYLYAPLARKLSDEEVALHIESKHPELQDRLVTVMQFGGRNLEPIGRHIIEGLIKDTFEYAKRFDFKSTLDLRRLKRNWQAIAVISGLFILSSLIFPSILNQAVSRVLTPWESTSPLLATRFEVSPGNAKIPRGEPQQINVKVLGKKAESITIFYKIGQEEWQQSEMIQDEPRQFSYLFYNIPDRVQYYISANEKRSQTYNISVFDAPKLLKIDVAYTYPSYTRQQPLVQEGDGNVRAVVGSVAEVKALTNKGVVSANLTLKGKTPQLMTISNGNQLSYKIEVLEDSSYTIDLECVDGLKNNVPIEYAITALKDELPKVSVKKPGRDIQATKIEEIEIEVEASDDIGLSDVFLKYSVNHAPEKSIKLKAENSEIKVSSFESRVSSSEVVKNFSASHMLYLEEFELNPGDLISYYAEAVDNNNIGVRGQGSGVGVSKNMSRNGSGRTKSDLYFIQIRPFREKFLESESSSGQSGQSGIMTNFVEEQKRIIRETWRVEFRVPSFEFRVKNKNDDLDEKRVLVKKIANDQIKLKEQLQELVDRLNLYMRESSIDPSMLMNFENALASMESGAKELNNINTQTALRHEEQALSYLLKAEVDLPKIISRASSANPQLSQELKLDLQDLKSQLEDRQKLLDHETHDKSKELLQKVEKLLDEQRKLTEQSKELSKAQNRPQSIMNELSQKQKQLSNQASNLAQQRNNMNMSQKNSNSSSRAGNSLQQASSEMESASNYLRRGEPALGAAKGTKAEEVLKEAIRDLQKNASNLIKEDLSRLEKKVEELINDQKRLKAGSERLRENWRQRRLNPEEQREAGEMALEQGDLQQDLSDLKVDLRGSIDRLKESHPDANQSLNKALRRIDEEQIPQNMQQAEENLNWRNFDFARFRQNQVVNSLARVKSDLSNSRANAAKNDEEKLEALQKDLAEWRQELEELERQMSQLSKDKSNLTPEQKQQLDDLAQRQREILDQAQQRQPSAQQLDITNHYSEWMNAMRSWRSFYARNPAPKFDLVFRSLDALEDAIDQKLSVIQKRLNLSQIRKENIPPKYRKLVEKYYQALSE